MVCALCNALAPFLSALLPSCWLSAAVLAPISPCTRTCTSSLSDFSAFRPYVLCAVLYLMGELPCVLAREPELSEIWAMLVWGILRGRCVARWVWLPLTGWSASWGPVPSDDILPILGWWSDHLDRWQIFLRFISWIACSVSRIRPLLHCASA